MCHVLEFSVIFLPWSRSCFVLFFCWLIPASPHACLTTQSSSLLASCPNQFICKQVCFFLSALLSTLHQNAYTVGALSLPAGFCALKAESVIFFMAKQLRKEILSYKDLDWKKVTTLTVKIEKLGLQALLALCVHFV